MLKRFTVLLGITLILAAAIANPWLVSRLYNPWAPLPGPVRLLIGLADLLLAATGLLLIRYRSHPGVGASAVSGSIALIVCVAASELFLRITGVQTGVIDLFVPTDETGGRLQVRPGLELTTQVENARIELKTNSRGMRQGEVRVEKRPDVTRVAFVGDSFTFGLWASSSDRAFVALAASELASEKIEVLNFGVPGFGFKDIEHHIRTEVSLFRPDYIVVASFNGNDFVDTYLGDNRAVTMGSGLLRDRKEIEEKVPPEFRDPWNFRTEVLERLRLYGLLRNLLKNAFPAPEPEPQRGFTPDGRTYYSRGFWSRTDYPAFAQAARDISIETLRRIHQFCATADAELLIVAVPYSEQIYFPESFANGFDVRLPQGHLEQFARELSVPYLDLQPGLADYARRTGMEIHFASDGHFNDAGHAAVGELVVPFLRESIRKETPR